MADREPAASRPNDAQLQTAMSALRWLHAQLPQDEVLRVEVSHVRWALFAELTETGRAAVATASSGQKGRRPVSKLEPPG